jgi:hypothetical protein
MTLEASGIGLSHCAFSASPSMMVPGARNRPPTALQKAASLSPAESPNPGTTGQRILMSSSVWTISTEEQEVYRTLQNKLESAGQRARSHGNA